MTATASMTQRNSSAYTLGYDPENRLTSVSGGATASFVYDGDPLKRASGNRVKGTVNGVTTVYPSTSLRAGVGNYYELSGARVNARITCTI
jgi:hypothetical protein